MGARAFVIAESMRFVSAASSLMETLDVLVLSPVFKTGVGCEEHPGQVRFLCVSAVLPAARAGALTL